MYMTPNTSNVFRFIFLLSFHGDIADDRHGMHRFVDENYLLLPLR